MQTGAAANAAPPINDLKTDTSTEEQLQTKAPANRRGTRTQPQRPPSLRYERRGCKSHPVVQLYDLFQAHEQERPHLNANVSDPQTFEP